MSFPFILIFEQTALQHPKRVNPLQLRILFKVLGLLPLISSLPSTFGSMMRRPERTSWRTSRNVAFIQNAKLSCQILLIVIRTWGQESLRERPLRCPIVFIQEFYSNIHSIDTYVPRFAITFRSTHIVVTPDHISEVLHILRVAHPNYPSYEYLQTVSKDELLSHFCETSSTCGGKLNTLCSSFCQRLEVS